MRRERKIGVKKKKVGKNKFVQSWEMRKKKIESQMGKKAFLNWNGQKSYGKKLMDNG